MEYLFLHSLKYIIETFFIHLHTILGAIILLFSMFYIKNRHENFDEFIKVLGILLISGIAIFENNLYLYLLSIVIVAALFVNNNFLEKIVAIIIRNNEYFDYKIRELTETEKSEKINDKIKEIVGINEVKNKKCIEVRADNKNRTAIEKNVEPRIFSYLRLVNLATIHLSRIYGHILKKNIKIIVKNKTFVFDAIIVGREKDEVFEIKITPSTSSYKDLSYIDKIKEYSILAEKEVKITFVYIVSEAQIKSFQSSLKKYIDTIAQEKFIEIDFIILTPEELGYEDED